MSESVILGWCAMWVNPYGTWSNEAAEALPNGDVVLLVDDAHTYSETARSWHQLQHRYALFVLRECNSIE